MKNVNSKKISKFNNKINWKSLHNSRIDSFFKFMEWPNKRIECTKKTKFKGRVGDWRKCFSWHTMQYIDGKCVWLKAVSFLQSRIWFWRFGKAEPSIWFDVQQHCHLPHLEYVVVITVSMCVDTYLNTSLISILCFFFANFQSNFSARIHFNMPNIGSPTFFFSIYLIKGLCEFKFYIHYSHGCILCTLPSHLRMWAISSTRTDITFDFIFNVYELQTNNNKSTQYCGKCQRERN